MKKKFLALICLLMAGGAATISATAILTVNGNVVEKVPTHITFEGDNVTVHYGDNTTSTHDMGDVSFTFDTATGLTDLNTFTFNGAILGGALEVSGLKGGTSVNVYSIAGHLAAAGAADTDGNASLDVSNLEAGVYVLQAGNNIVKFVKR